MANLLWRYWATSTIVVTVFVVGITSGASWNGVPRRRARTTAWPTGSRRCRTDVVALRHRHVLRAAGSSCISPSSRSWVVVLASVYERRVGTSAPLVVAIGGQSSGALLTRSSSGRSTRANGRGHVGRHDARPRHLGGRIRVDGRAVRRDAAGVAQSRARGVGAYLFAMLLNSGQLWDVEHFVAFVIGVFAGPMLVGRLPTRPQLHFGPRTQRAAVALIVALSAVTSLIEAVSPATVGRSARVRSPSIRRASRCHS